MTTPEFHRALSKAADELRRAAQLAAADPVGARSALTAVANLANHAINELPKPGPQGWLVTLRDAATNSSLRSGYVPADDTAHTQALTRALKASVGMAGARAKVTQTGTKRIAFRFIDSVFSLTASWCDDEAAIAEHLTIKP